MRCQRFLAVVTATLLLLLLLHIHLSILELTEMSMVSPATISEAPILLQDTGLNDIHLSTPAVKNIKPSLIAKVNLKWSKTKCFIPDEYELQDMSKIKLAATFHKYLSASQQIGCFNVQTFSATHEAKKWSTCFDSFPAECLVYSFSFQDVTMTLEKNLTEDHWCNVQYFNPYFRHQKMQFPAPLKGKLFLHEYGIANRTYEDRGARLFYKPFYVIRRKLGHFHKSLEILKIDIDGGEWEVLAEMLTCADILNVRQIIIVFFIGRTTGAETNEYYSSKLNLLRQMFYLGFRIYHSFCMDVVKSYLLNKKVCQRYIVHYMNLN